MPIARRIWSPVVFGPEPVPDRSSSVAPHPAARHRPPPGSEPNAMTILTASLQRLFAGTSRFSAPSSSQAVECGSRDQFAILGGIPLSATLAKLFLAEAAVPQIPIDGEPLATSRGFFLRRLSDAGPYTRSIVRAGPASETLPGCGGPNLVAQRSGSGATFPLAPVPAEGPQTHPNRALSLCATNCS